MTHHRIWDPLLRLFHWSLAGFFAVNALLDDPESALHRNIGYAIGALLVLRLIWGFIGPHSARFATFLPRRDGVRQQLTDMATGRQRVHLMHTPLGALMIFNLLGTLAAIVGTGWVGQNPNTRKANSNANVGSGMFARSWLSSG